MFIEFEKWHGCKNDFIICWVNQSQYANLVPSLQRKAKVFCDRNTGIGGDGLIILIHQNHETTKQLIIINSDGSLAKTCGNGIRCAALSVYQHALEQNKNSLESVELRMAEQEYSCQFVPQKGALLPLVQVDMGTPHLNEKNSWHRDALAFVRKTLNEHQCPHFLKEFYTCSLANNHLVFILEEEESLAKMREISQSLQKSPDWDGINVNFASPLALARNQIPLGMRNQELADPYKVFIWERGAGETPACGSGACAVSAALLSTGLIARSSWVPTLFPGGCLFAKQDVEEEAIVLCGPGEFIFSGKIEI